MNSYTIKILKKKLSSNFNLGFFLTIFICMNSLNIDLIFEVFNQGDEVIYKEAGLENLMNEDAVLLNTAVRGIESYWRLDEMFTSRKYDEYQKVRHLVKSRYFSKMFGYLNKVSYTKLEPFFDTIGDLGYGTVENSLEEYLEHFIFTEEYEKCTVIKKLLGIVRKLYYPELELI